MVRCGGFKRDGASCAVSVAEEQGYCWWHSPENAEERRRATSRGGKAKANSLTRELHRQLAKLVDDVVTGELQAYRGAVACKLINGRIRLIETREEGARAGGPHRAPGAPGAEPGDRIVGAKTCSPKIARR